MNDPVSIVELQKSARVWRVYLIMSSLCFHNFVIGFSYVYGGLTLPYHKVY